MTAPQRALLFVVMFTTSGLGAVACARRNANTLDASTDGAALSAFDAGAIAVVDAGDPHLSEEARRLALQRLEAGTYDGPFAGATNMVVSVLTAPLWPETDDAGSQRLGYIRHGSKVPILEGEIDNEECTEGWYVLVQGGYICSKSATTDLKSPEIKRAPKGPDLDAGLPYRYGYNITNGTPVYRRVLSIEDRKKYEPWLAPRPAPEPSGGEEGSAAPAAEEEKPEKPERPAEKVGALAGSSGSPTPWYLRDKTLPTGKPDVTLGELRGHGVLVRRMVRGFFTALDREFKAANARWWRNTYGFAIPFERIVLQPKLSDYHGSWVPLPLPPPSTEPLIALDAGGLDAAWDGEVQDAAPPVDRKRPTEYGFVLGGSAVKIIYDPATGKTGWAEALPKRRAVALTAEHLVAGGVALRGTPEGFYVREGDLKLAKPAPPPDLGPNEKWIDVDLTRQMLVAFEGMTPVFGTLVSSGRRNPVDKDKDHPTPTGMFRVREKHITSTMDGDVAADGPYSLEDVPWVMYFQGSFALHGAFWHDGFGGQRSHGCVNLAPDDARALFWWADPPLPEGWHGVFATDARPGTRIVIHEDPPPKGRH